ncbi:MAG: hypothetical protein ABF356_11645 [Polycyclovorans sp.]
MIEKHHVLGYEAGTRVNFMRLPDGEYYVQQTASTDGGVIAEPADWTLLHIELDRQWICDLGCPVTVFFFRNLRSFQGPLREDQLPSGERKPGRG